jgi:NADH dehydrogenase
MDPRGDGNGGRPRVLVLGGGFGGIGAAQRLRKSAVDVVLVEKHNYHTFQPLLYQVATSLLERDAVGHPIRDLFHGQGNARLHKDRVTAIDLDAREARFVELEPLRYDYLVLGLGAEVNFFGVEGAAEHAFPLYTLADAVRLKDHILRRWEEADRKQELVGDGALNIVVVGGGPTGVETAGALAELYEGVFRKDYPGLPDEEAKIVLVEAGPELFPMFKPDIRAYTAKALAKRGVEVMTGEVVESITPRRVALKSGTVLDAHTLVWGAGLRGNALVRSLGLDLERGDRKQARQLRAGARDQRAGPHEVAIRAVGAEGQPRAHRQREPVEELLRQPPRVKRGNEFVRERVLCQQRMNRNHAGF